MFFNELLKSVDSSLLGVPRFFLLCSLTQRDPPIQRTIIKRSYSEMTDDRVEAGNHLKERDVNGTEIP